MALEKMQAIILASGRGFRLKPITDEIPKSLVEVNGTPFIVNELEVLSKHKEIREVIIVVGYKKDLIKKRFGNRYKGMKILYVENDKWDRTNNKKLTNGMRKVDTVLTVRYGSPSFDFKEAQELIKGVKESEIRVGERNRIKSKIDKLKRERKF